MHSGRPCSRDGRSTGLAASLSLSVHTNAAPDEPEFAMTVIRTHRTPFGGRRTVEPSLALERDLRHVRQGQNRVTAFRPAAVCLRIVRSPSVGVHERRASFNA
jgi:hypothetical protein